MRFHGMNSVLVNASSFRNPLTFRQKCLVTTAIAAFPGMMLGAAPAAAECVLVGSVVTCSVNDATGFADASSGLTVNVSNGITVNGVVPAIDIGDNGIINNDGIVDGVLMGVGGTLNVENTGVVINNIDFAAGAGSNAVNVMLGGVVIADVNGNTGDEALTIENGSSFVGNANLGEGDNSVVIRNDGVLTGSLTTLSGDDTLSISNMSTIVANADLGDGDNSVTVRNSAAIVGTLTTGSGDDDILVENGSALVGAVVTGNGTNTVTINVAELSAGLTMGTGDDTLTITGGGWIIGSAMLDDGDNEITMNTGAEITVDLTTGTGDDTLNMSDFSIISGGATLGDGSNEVTMAGASEIVGILITGIGDDSISLDGASRVSDDLITGGGSDEVSLTDGSFVADLLDVGDGDDEVMMDGASFAAFFTIGDGNDELVLENGSFIQTMNVMGTGEKDISILSGSSINSALTADLNSTTFLLIDDGVLNGLVTLGNGNNEVIMRNDAFLNGNLIGGSGEDFVLIEGPSTVTGNVVTSLGNDHIITTGTITGNIGAGIGDDIVEIGNDGALPGGTLNGGLDDDILILFGDEVGQIFDRPGTGFEHLIKNGTGDWEMTAVTTFADVRLNDGILRSADDNFLGVLTGPLTFDGGTLNPISPVFASTARDTTLLAGGGTILADSNFTMSGDITGVGALAKDGTGDLKLNGTNDFTGGIDILNGRVEGDTDSIPGDVRMAAGTQIEFDQGFAGTHSGDISGDGSLLFSDSGPLTLAGTNTYTGGTEISDDGALIGDTFSLQGDIFMSDAAGDASVTFNQDFNGTYSGDLTGFGQLFKEGAGTLTTTGDLLHTNDTTVNGGRLDVDGTLDNGGMGVVTLNIGTALGGTGTITSDVISNGATTAPGNSIGELTIVGDWTMDDISTLEIELNPTVADVLNVSGTATIDGTLALIAETDVFYVDNSTFLFLDAGTIVGDYDTVTGTTVNQFIELETSEDTITVNRTDYDTVALTTNQMAIAGGLDTATAAGITPGSDFEAILILLDHTADPAAARDIFDAVNGENYNAFVQVGHDTGRQFLRQIDERMYDFRAFDPAEEKSGLQAWARAYGGMTDLNGKDALDGFETDSFGFAAGFDAQITKGVVGGIAIGYSETDIDISERPGNDGDQDSLQFGAYITANFEHVFVESSIAYIDTDNSFDRVISFPGVDRVARSSFDGDQFAAKVKVGGNFDVGRIATIRPYVALDYSDVDINGFTEAGADSLNLVVSELDDNELHGSIGVQVERTVTTASGATFVPSAHLAYRTLLGNSDRVMTAQFEGSAASTHQLIGATGGDDQLVAGLGITGRLTDNVYVYLDYEGLFQNNRDSHYVGGGVRVKF